MASWKKVIVSGSNASLADVSASGGFIGDGSAITGIVVGSMAANSIDSDQYVNRSIDTVHIGLNQVTLAEMAGLARGKIISGDSSGDPVALSPGGANTVLQSDGTDITYNTVATAMIANDAVNADKLAANAVVNASIAASAAIVFTKLENLDSTKMLVGNGSNKAAEVSISGDVTMANTGAVTIGNGKVLNAMLEDGAVDEEELADDAVTADKLAANAVVNASIASGAAIAHSKLAAIAATKLLVGNGSNVPVAVALSGDVTMNNAGAVTIGTNKVTLAKMAGLARGKIISGDSSGDPVALAAGGANTVLQSDGTDITYNTVATAMIANNAVNGDKLADSITVAAELTVAGHGLTVKQITASAHISGTLAGDIIGFASGSFLNIEATNEVKAGEFIGGGENLTGVTVADNAITLAKMADLASTKFIVGNGSNNPTAVVMSGDATMANNGAVTIEADAVSYAKMQNLGTANRVLGATSTGVIGEVQIVTAMIANDAIEEEQIGDGEVKTAALANDAVDADKLAANAVVNASIASGAAIAHSKLAAIAATKLLVGNGSNVPVAVALSGDVTMNNAGVVAIGATKVVNAMLEDGAVDEEELADDAVTADKLAANAVVNASIASGAAIAHSKLAAIAATKLLVGNGSNVPTAVPLSGDVTMNNAGAVTIANNAVNGDKLADSIVIAADLTVTGDFLVSGDSVTVNTANLAIEDPFILLKSGSSNTTDSGIIFGGSTGAVNTGKALVWDASYNDNDGRLAVSTTAVAANATANFGASTAGYYLAGVFLGSEADVATAKGDHEGNIRIESDELFMYF